MEATTVLTAVAIEKYKPGVKRRRIRDAKAKSLFLIVMPSGHKSFQMRFRRPDGKMGKITLGPYSDVELQGEPQIGQPLSLAAARQLAAQVHRRRALGEDVVSDHKARKHRFRDRLKDRASVSFAAYARQFLDEHRTRSGEPPRRLRETAGMLGFIDGEVVAGGLAERWADKPVAEIAGHDLWSVIDEARRSGIPGRGRRNKGISEARGRALFSALSNLFAWLQQHRRIERNPCEGILKSSARPARDRTLTNDEIRWFWAACELMNDRFEPLLKILLLTGARRREVGGMRRAELDEDVWRLPGTRTKNHRAHIVPLAPLVRDLIPAGPGTFVFSTTGGEHPVSGFSRLKPRLDAAMLAIAQKERRDVTIAPWRLHDLRRTAVTGMAELGIAPHVIELVVNHAGGARAGVAGIYNRSELLAERRAALERWAAHIDGLTSGRPTKVVRLNVR
jgi:integrase